MRVGEELADCKQKLEAQRADNETFRGEGEKLVRECQFLEECLNRLNAAAQDMVLAVTGCPVCQDKVALITAEFSAASEAQSSVEQPADGTSAA